MIRLLQLASVSNIGSGEPRCVQQLAPILFNRPCWATFHAEGATSVLITAVDAECCLRHRRSPAKFRPCGGILRRVHRSPFGMGVWSSTFENDFLKIFLLHHSADSLRF